MVDARQELNFLLVDISNKVPNLWAVDLQEITLTADTATYTLDANTVEILDAYVTTISGGVSSDRMIFPISRSDYAALPNKTQTGTVTTFWFNRQITPQVSLWQVPSADDTFILKYYRMRQIQDANVASGENIEVPYRFLDWVVAGLSHRLSRIWKPELEAARKADAVEAWAIASTEDTENVPLYLTPMIGGYYTR